MHSADVNVPANGTDMQTRVFSLFSSICFFISDSRKIFSSNGTRNVESMGESTVFSICEKLVSLRAIDSAYLTREKFESITQVM